MKALIYRTSSCGFKSAQAPLSRAERAESSKTCYRNGQCEYYWFINVDSIEDLKAIADETRCELVLSFRKLCENYGESFSVEIYDDYRE